MLVTSVEIRIDVVVAGTVADTRAHPESGVETFR